MYYTKHKQQGHQDLKNFQRELMAVKSVSTVHQFLQNAHLSTQYAGKQRF